jgi:hypothetical protein
VFEQTCFDREARQVESPSPPGLVAVEVCAHWVSHDPKELIAKLADGPKYRPEEWAKPRNPGWRGMCYRIWVEHVVVMHAIETPNCLGLRAFLDGCYDAEVVPAEMDVVAGPREQRLVQPLAVLARHYPLVLGGRITGFNYRCDTQA